MTEPHIKSYIEDNVRKATDSSNKATMEVLRSMQLSLEAVKNQIENSHEQEFSSRKVYREEMISSVKDQIQITVNGKIDKIDKKLDVHIADVTPMIKEYKDQKTGENYLKKKVSLIAWIGGSIVAIGGGWVILRQVITKLW